MKKNMSVFAALVAGVIFFAGCSSAQLSMQEHSPVAVFSIIGNAQIPWVADDPNNPDEADSDGILSSMVNKLIDGQNPEIVTTIDRLDYVNDSVAQIFPEITGCEVIDKDTVLSSEGYKKLRSSYFNLLSATKVATGYKDLTTLGAKNARIAMESIGAKSALILNFTFQKKLLKGNKWNGELAAFITMKAKLLNERGKEIINKTYTAQSSERIQLSSHKYDKSALVNSINEGIDSVIRQFALEFVGDAETAVVPDDEPKGQAIAIPARQEPEAGDAEAAASEIPADTAAESESTAQ